MRPVVLQLCLTLDTGGLERVVVNLSNALAASRIAPRLCTVGHTRGEVIPECVAKDVPWAELSGPPHFSLKTALRLAHQARRHQVALIHAHGTQPLVYALSASLLCGVPVIFTKHSSHQDLDFFQRRRWFNALACRRVRQFVGVSEQATALLRETFKPAAGRCRTQINGTELAPRHPGMDRRWPGHQMRGRPVLLTICRLSPEKDLPTLLRAFAAVRAEFPRAQLWIVGDGPQRAELVRLAEQLRVIPHVHFWGFQRQVWQWLAGADVFINSSLTEGVSISILEAMSAGLPIVATNVGGTPTIVRPGVNGILTEPSRPLALAEAIRRLLRDRELRRRMGEHSRKQIEQHWSIQRMAGQYLELYLDTLTGPPCSPP